MKRPGRRGLGSLKRRSRTGFGRLVGIMAALRGPGGCPWDREQTHASLLKHLREESREVELAVRRRDWDNLKEELGDLLLQVLFHAEMARGGGRFDIAGVMAGLEDKLIRRHPHVFGKGRRAITAAEVVRSWKRIKAAEKRRGRSRR